MSADDLVKTVSDLISTCRDSEEGFGRAAKGVHSETLRQTFDLLARKRSNFAGELAAEVERLGSPPAAIGHGGGPLSSGWRDLDARIRPRDDAALLAERQRGEQSTLRHYEHALAEDLPAGIRVVIEGQYLSIQETIDQLRRMAKVRRAG